MLNVYFICALLSAPWISPAVGIPFFHSQEEATHVSAPFPEPGAVSLFRSSLYSQDPSLAINDLLAHHALLKLFCQREMKESRGGRCTWSDYYSILNYVRQPFSDVYDPGMDKVGTEASSFDYPQECTVIGRPSSKEFLWYIERNRPFVIRGEGGSWRALQRWTKEYLLRRVGEASVPVSISDTGDFVGPEPLQRWGTVPGADPATEPMVLARPATKTLLFRDLIEFYDAFKEMLRVNASASLPSLYMEYMPLSALGDGSLTEDVLPIRWSRFLNLKLMLLWLGGGGSRKNGRLHFDNYENLMTVVLGKKTFMLYDPAQSARVYADMPMRPANLEAQLEPQTMECGADGYCAGIGLRKWSFQRRSNKVINVSSSVHTYSPVDVLRPDYNLFPLLRMLKGFNCTLYEGDMIYVPSAWWHEVITDDNQEGLSAGINYFFDPYFVRRRDFGHVYLHESRKYSHIRSGPAQTARPCTNNYVCFRKIKSSMRRKRFQIRSGG